MPSKNTKEAKTEEVKQSKVKSIKKEDNDSEDEVMETKPKGSKGSKVEVKPVSKGEASKAKGSKSKKIEESDQESDEQEELDEQDLSDEQSDQEQTSESEDEDQTESEEKKPKEKKTKESFEELTKKLETSQSGIKEIEKEIKELEKQIEAKKKLTREHERLVTSISKILLKTHNDEVSKALKSKPKRKGNVNGGFNKEQPVPEILREFLGLDSGACMARPKVMSALNNKFSDLNLKKGQITTLDKSTAKALGLGKEGDGKEIKFTEFQSFLASFYPKKETKELNA